MTTICLKYTRRVCSVLAALVAVPATTAGCAQGLEHRFRTHIEYLASDELEGRGVGSRGIELAAEYIAGQFAEIGLEPAGDDETYFQTFSMTLRRKLTEDTRLSFSGDITERRQGRDFIPFNFSSDEAFKGDVVFCGYGIEDSEKDHDDFVHVDLDGKVALMLRGEPPSWADEDGYPTRHALLRNKVYNAKDRGALAVLIVNQVPLEDEADELMEFISKQADAYGIPAFHVSRSMADAQIARAGKGSLLELQERLDTGGFVSTGLPDVQASGEAGFERVRAPTRNVIGRLRGEGPLSDEFVVIGAHYDHLGIRKPTMRKFQAGKLVKDSAEAVIHNGADDNASGTSGLIEVARLFASGPRPKRSIMFIAFTAEESGLHGSKHYVNHPSAPLDRTVAMLNMDMIGRMEPGTNGVQVFGAKTGKEFIEILEQAGRRVGLEPLPSGGLEGRSDNAAFVRKGIPSMHLFSGHHRDYHKPSDDTDKINFKDGAKVTRLAYHVIRDLATRDSRPEFEIAARDDSGDRSGSPGYRVVMGIAPGYVDDGETGMAVDAVNSEGPADLAGMKAGDRIIRIKDREVNNIHDYMAATRDNDPGDIVTVVVLRDGDEVTLRVTLTSSR